MAHYLKGHQDIRIVSIGTGGKPFKGIESADELGKAAYAKKLDEFMMNMDIYTADNWLDWNFDDSSYIRLQCVSKIGMDKIDPVSIAGLKKNGDDLYAAEKVQLESMLRAIIDERYGPQSVSK